MANMWNHHGGKRKGSGRKPLSENTEVKKVSITLSAEEWKKIEEVIQHGHVDSLAEYFRVLHMAQQSGV